MSPRTEQENRVVFSDDRNVTVEYSEGVWTLILFDKNGALCDEFIDDINCSLSADRVIKHSTETLDNTKSVDGIRLPREKEWMVDKHKASEQDARLVSNLIWKIVCSLFNNQEDS